MTGVVQLFSKIAFVDGGGGGTRDEYVLCDELLLGTIVWHVFF